MKAFGGLKRFTLYRRLRSIFGYLFQYIALNLYGRNALKRDFEYVTEKYLLSACIRVKDEARFLPELIAYHLCVGVQHFYIYDNNSTDNILIVLDEYIKRGIVTYLNWPVIPAYPSCYVDFFKEYGNCSTWVAFIDADEFIVEKNKGDLIRLLGEKQSNSAIGLNWRYFGSSYHETVPDGLVVSNFRRSNVKFDDHVKVIARPRAVIGLFNLHNFFYAQFQFAISVNDQPIWGSFVNPSPTAQVFIHHYVYRSRSDYARKVNRGFADAQGAKDRGRSAQRIEIEFNRHNDIENSDALKYSAEVSKILKEYGFDSTYWCSK